MPKVILTKEERASARLAEWVYGQMKMQRITQKEVAKRLGISQQAVYNKLHRRSFEFEDFICFLDIFQPDESQISRLVGKGD